MRVEDCGSRLLHLMMMMMTTPTGVDQDERVKTDKILLAESKAYRARADISLVLYTGLAPHLYIYIYIYIMLIISITIDNLLYHLLTYITYT